MCCQSKKSTPIAEADLVFFLIATLGLRLYDFYIYFALVGRFSCEMSVAAHYVMLLTSFYVSIIRCHGDRCVHGPCLSVILIL